MSKARSRSEARGGRRDGRARSQIGTRDHPRANWEGSMAVFIRPVLNLNNCVCVYIETVSTAITRVSPVKLCNRQSAVRKKPRNAMPLETRFSELIVTKLMS